MFSRYSALFSGVFVSGQRRYISVFLQTHSSVVEEAEFVIVIFFVSARFFFAGIE